jgi:uncharacterized protein YcaQ
MMTTISTRMARRLALCRAGMLKPGWTVASGGDAGSGPGSGAGDGALRRRAHGIIDRFGYLQLDTVSVAGARSHATVLMSRISRFRPELGESLLRPGEPLFEYWGHEVCWMPLSLYPVLGWRRRRFRLHPWWRGVIGTHLDLADAILKRVRDDGPLKSSDLEGSSGKGWWEHKPAKTVAVGLWSAGELAVRERRAFQRTFDLAERVIPEKWRHAPEPTLDEALETLLLKALDGHGWAQTGTLARTWRLRLMKDAIDGALGRLADAGAIVACAVDSVDGGRVRGWIRPDDLELAARLERLRPTPSSPVLLISVRPLAVGSRAGAQALRFRDVDRDLRSGRPPHLRVLLPPRPCRRETGRARRPESGSQARDVACGRLPRGGARGVRLHRSRVPRPGQ